MNNNNNKISNPKTEVPTGMELNEKDYITCLLTTLKDMVKNYAIAMTEASNKFLFETYRDIFLKLMELQREVYDVMFRKGWYELEQAETQKISTKFQTLLKEYQSLSS